MENVSVSLFRHNAMIEAHNTFKCDLLLSTCCLDICDVETRHTGETKRKGKLTYWQWERSCLFFKVLHIQTNVGVKLHHI